MISNKALKIVLKESNDRIAWLEKKNAHNDDIMRILFGNKLEHIEINGSKEDRYKRVITGHYQGGLTATRVLSLVENEVKKE